MGTAQAVEVLTGRWSVCCGVGVGGCCRDIMSGCCGRVLSFVRGVDVIMSAYYIGGGLRVADDCCGDSVENDTCPHATVTSDDMSSTAASDRSRDRRLCFGELSANAHVSGRGSECCPHCSCLPSQSLGNVFIFVHLRLLALE